jgi:hypothetical protein
MKFIKKYILSFLYLFLVLQTANASFNWASLDFGNKVVEVELPEGKVEGLAKEVKRAALLGNKVKALFSSGYSLVSKEGKAYKLVNKEKLTHKDYNNFDEFIDDPVNIPGSGAPIQGAGNVLDDALLNTARVFDDNVLDVASVGFQNWKTFQNRVAQQLQSLHPGKRIGNQITLDVTYIENGITKTKTIIPDNLIQEEVNGIRKYKVIDAKTAQTDLVNKADLKSTCTQNQQPIYKMIDGDATAGTITKVEMRGGQATGAFPNELFNQATGKANIQLEANVEFWVNSSTTDFTQYLIRPRIK